MSAGVHDADLLPQIGGPDRRLELVRRVFGYRQGIHVGTHGHHGTWPTASEDADDARVSHSGGHLHPQGSQVLRHQRCGFEFAVAELGVLVNLMAQLDNLGRRCFHSGADPRVH